jgi:hypothetical protein
MLNTKTQIPSRLTLPGLLLLLSLLPQSLLRAEETVDYLHNIKPLLAARCFSCHGGLKQKEGLRLDTVELMKRGGKAGPAILPGNSAKSLLIDHVTSRGDAARMPPETEGEPLKPREIALLKTWIDRGAIGPADEKPETDPNEHWAFKPPVRPIITKAGNPIDALLSAEWNKRGLKPQLPAEKSLLLRRVYLDLIGLPPTQEQYSTFLEDTAPDAYEKTVDHLLASKQYGERWGRHWMDIWRYSDWWGLGAEVRNSQKHIWHWRDWIIESLNADKGYDQMIREMLAADELYPTDRDKIRASGFLARQYFRFNRNSWLEETVEHTSKAFLGLTMNCSKCHDHKFDPIAQQDFYRFRAFFEPYQVRTDMVPGEPDFEKDGIPRGFDCNLDTPTYLFIRGNEKSPRKDLLITPGVPAILSFDKMRITPVQLPLEAYMPGLNPSIIEGQLSACEKQLQAAKQELERARAATSSVDDLDDKKKPEHAAQKLALAEKSLTTATLHTVLTKARIAADKARYQQPPAANANDLAKAAGKLEQQLAIATAEESLAKVELDNAAGVVDKKLTPAKKVAAARDALAKAKKAAEKPSDTYTSLRGSLKTAENNLETEASRNKPFPTTSTGRRSALAAWMTDARNPLVARVAANHMWARHFGKPLVATVFDFGRKGSPPTHPELLDFLAVELRDTGWSMKRLHRLIVTSNAYQMSSSSAGASSADLAIDPENRYLWRMNPVRMESETIRDSLFSLSGELDLTMGGPSIPVAEASRRRSLYFFHSHNEHQTFLASFDDASVLECYRRAESIVPQQALALENSKVVLAAADKIARRINEKKDAAFIKAAFLLILGSSPTAEELAACGEGLKELQEIAAREKKADGAIRARINLVHALLNHNDFVTVR